MYGETYSKSSIIRATYKERRHTTNEMKRTNAKAASTKIASTLLPKGEVPPQSTPSHLGMYSLSFSILAFCNGLGISRCVNQKQVLESRHACHPHNQALALIMYSDYGPLFSSFLNGDMIAICFLFSMSFLLRMHVI